MDSENNNYKGFGEEISSNECQRNLNNQLSLLTLEEKTTSSQELKEVNDLKQGIERLTIYETGQRK
jgi:hypothetical protein